MDKLTARQQEVLGWVRDHIEAHGLPPTRMELAEAFGFSSPNAAEDHLKVLARKGHLILTPGSSRGIRLVEQLGLPLIGRVAAGSPLLAEEHIQARYQVDPALFEPRADYLLKVRGMSMRDAGILDGDLLAVHRTTEVRSGQIIVARLGNDVTVKRLKKRGYHAELIAENPDFKPIEVDLRDENFAVEGLAVGVIRNKSF